jgi:hypothetical protein
MIISQASDNQVKKKFSPTRLSNLTLFDKLEHALTFSCSTKPVQDKHALLSQVERCWGWAEVFVQQ